MVRTRAGMNSKASRKTSGLQDFHNVFSEVNKHAGTLRTVRTGRVALAFASVLALAFTLTVTLGASVVPLRAQAQEPEVRSQSTTQMNSAPENVYVNSVTDPSVRVQNFNTNWKFKLGDVSGAEEASYDDSSWSQVNLPHDYSIDQPYSTSGEAESAYKPGGVGWYRKTFEVSKDLQGKRFRLDFDGVYMDSTVWVNGHKVGTHPYGYSPFSFDITPYLKPGEQNVVTVRVNAQTPSSRWYSGAGIGRDVDLVVTDPVHVAKDGVKVTTPQLASEAGGNVTTQLKTTITNKGDKAATVQVTQTIFARGADPSQAIGSVTTERTVDAGASDTFDATATTTSAPTLWDTDNPALYTVRTEVKADGKVVDTYDTTFGYRYFSFDAEKGFLLNGRPVKIKGVCMHHDQGSLGAVSSADAINRQVKIMKDMGVNAIRTSHNTPSRQLVEACNEQGILVDYEFFDGWTSVKNGNSKDYARFFSTPMGESELLGADPAKTWAQYDLETSIARDYNAPSIVMWSLGNEMTEGTIGGFFGLSQVQGDLINWTRAADPTRPVTTGDNRLKNGLSTLNPEGLANAGGVVGMNYADGSVYDRIHRQHPDWNLIGSETASAINSRGVYGTHGQDSSSQQLTSYDYSAVNWGHYASQAWYDVLTRDFVAGEFVWTGFDYLGEPTPWNGISSGAKGRWPSPKNSYFGIVDTAGLPKDSYYFYQSQWNDSKHTLHLLPAWNGDVVKKNRDGTVDVNVYTDAHAVKLYFTPAGSTARQDLGTKTFTTKTTPVNGFKYQIYEGDDKNSAEHRNLYLTWKVPYADGTITAEAYDEAGNKLDTSDWDGRQSLTTAGQPKKLSVSINRTSMSANGTDLAYLTVSVLDEKGNMVPNAANNVKFDVSGAGTLAGIDNGSSPDHQSYRDNNRNAFSGQLTGIVRAGTSAGEINVTVSAEGLEPTTITIPVSASGGGETPQKSVDSLFYSRYYYVKTGSSLTLPKTVQVRYSDGTAQDEPVTWDEYDVEKLKTPGTFTVSGTVAGLRVTATVTVLDSIAALMNYSTTTPVGQAPVLPDSRPAVQADGTVLNANFPITWESAPEGAYDQEGTVTLKGTANVFGRDVLVTSTVRVQKEKVTLSKNVAPAASLSQDIPEDKQSDTLSAITDSSTSVSNNSGGGPNPTCWTTYANSQAGNKTASITFRYATQQRIGQAKIHFFTDSYSARLPKAGTTVIEVSENGEDWTKVAAKETVGTAQGRVTPYTYDFTPVSATYVRITVTNSDEILSGRKPCIGITEVELLSAVGSFSSNSAASLDALEVNGKSVGAGALAAGEYNTPALLANVKAQTTGNASLTVLPPHENKVRLLLESEDHSTRSVFTINLGVEAPLDDASDERDYPSDKITATAGSEVEDRHVSATEGKIDYAFDGDENTHWHSTWAPTSTDKHWVNMELEAPATIEALRYLPRSSSPANGTITEALVQYSDDGVDWKDAGRATWTSPADSGYERTWKLVKFDKPITAKHFRLMGVHTYADSWRNDKFISAAEIRLRQAKTTTDISDAIVSAPHELLVDRVSESEPAMFDPSQVKVTLPSKQSTLLRSAETISSGKELTYGVDYVLEYTNNTAEGTATVRARGIDEYSGTTAATTFTVAIRQAELQGIAINSVPSKTAYAVGEKLDPSGLTLTLAMSDGTSKEVTYGEDTKADFTFEPSVDTAFEAAGTQKVTVTYQGKKAKFTVTVARPTTPPDNPGGTPDSPGGNPDNPSPQPPNGNQSGDNQGGGNQEGTGQNGSGNTDGSAPSGDSGKQGSGKKGKSSGLPWTGDAFSVTALIGLAGTGVVCMGSGCWMRKRGK